VKVEVREVVEQVIQLESILEGGFEVRKVVGILAAWQGGVKK
jgi:hypothetical protein